MLAAALTAFISVFVAEFGDKTQLVSLSLASRYPPLQVLAGAMVALAAVLGLAVGAGGFIASYIPAVVITAASGAFFIVMGLLTLARRERVDTPSTGRAGFYQTMVLVFLAELGDKTQMAAVLLAASFGQPLAVFAGAMVAMFFNHALAIFLGRRFFSRINPKLLKQGTAFLFMVIGLAMIILAGFSQE
ncbi:MAG: TMEM165/GDT1 family protein [Bacillota bacterium]